MLVEARVCYKINIFSVPLFVQNLGRLDEVFISIFCVPTLYFQRSVGPVVAAYLMRILLF